MLNLRVSSKKQAKIKLALQGCAGSGKTYSALLLAYGLTNDWTKIAIIDSENGSADLYAHLGNYNAFTNWQKITPRMNAFMQKILQSPSHVICTMRCKQDYVLSEKNGKMIPEKVGLKAVMRDGIDYEFTIVLDINMKHQAIASKDRTSLFIGKPDFIITPTTGQIILDWCNNGVNLDMIKQKINQAKTIEKLTSIYHQYPEWYQQLTSDFMQKKMQLQEENNKPIINYNPNFIHYGSNAVNASTQN